MSDSQVSARMREDWNARASEDAGYYVAFGRRDQDDEGFFATAAEVLKGLEWELSRVPADRRAGWRALEIGCGPGRLMRPMSRHFDEIHGVDVSDRMVALAKEKLAGIPNAYPQVTDGASLPQFEDQSIDFVYSYAVFQHIPSRDVVRQYMQEIHRVLKPGGLARLQFNGLPRTRTAEAAYNTWAGARFTADEILDFTQRHDFQVLAMEGVSTQYMWTTWRKHHQGWHAAGLRDSQANTSIRRVTNANSSEPVAPARGRFASISVWVDSLPPDAGLHDLRVRIDGTPGTITYIGPPDHSHQQQINVILPEPLATGLIPVELWWRGLRIAPPAVLRIIPPGPLVPSMTFVSDGVNLVAERRSETRSVRVVLEDVASPEEIRPTVGGLPVSALEYFCTDPRSRRYEVNFRLSDAIQPGPHALQIQIGKRKLPAVTLDVIAGDVIA